MHKTNTQKQKSSKQANKQKKQCRVEKEKKSENASNTKDVTKKVLYIYEWPHRG